MDSDLQVARGRFDDIDARTLYRILRLRTEVYVVEQECVYNDLDGRDLEPTTVLYWLDSDPAAPAVASTVRLLTEPDGSYTLGRVVTAASHRHERLAGRLIDAALEDVGAGATVRLHAQVRLAPWYERWGFRRDGPDLMQAGMPHTPMRRG